MLIDPAAYRHTQEPRPAAPFPPSHQAARAGSNPGDAFAAAQGRHDFRAAAQRAVRSLASRTALAPEESPAQSLGDLLGVEWDVFASHRDQCGGEWAADYEVVVLRRAIAPRAFAAVLICNEIPSQDVVPTTAWERAAPATRRTAMRRALRTAATADTLLDLFTKLQHRALTWPTVSNEKVPNAVLNAPRLGACRAILSTDTDEVVPIRFLLALDSFVGFNESGDLERLSTRLSWHAAQEAVLNNIENLGERLIQWRSNHHPDDLQSRRDYWLGGGLFVVASQIARLDAMMSEPPHDETGRILPSFVGAVTDAWLAKNMPRQTPHRVL